MRIETGHTLKEYMSTYGDAYRDGMAWDFTKSDVESGAVTLQDDMVYWEIGNRYYETTEYVD